MIFIFLKKYKMAFNPKELGIPETEEEADAINAAFEMQTLRQLALEFNANNLIIERIDLNRVKTKLEFIISLWEREVEIPETITFGAPYDKTFKKFVKEFHVVMHDDPINGEIEVAASIDESVLYIALQNPDIVAGLLAGSLNLSETIPDTADDIVTSNPDLELHRSKSRLERFNKIWRKLPDKASDSIPNYRKLRFKLNLLNNLQLAYIAIKCNSGNNPSKHLYQRNTSVYALYDLFFEE
jgi:hypothetical protein